MILTGTIIALFEIVIILWQIHLLFAQIGANRKMKIENDLWKNTIEDLYSNDIKTIIEQNRKLINSFNDIFINNKN